MFKESMEIEKVEVLSSETALLAQTKGEIDIQIATAKAYPRKIGEFLQEAEQLVTVDEDTAAGMFYSLPARRGSDKAIEGPSVRLAEVVAYAWKNLRAETNIESIDEHFVTAVGTVIDIERNVAVRQRVKKRITTKDGRRYSDDMIVNTCNSASSIAFREAVFKAVPRVFVKKLYEQSKQVAIGNASTLEARRVKALQWFKDQGVDVKTVVAKLNRKVPDEITLDDLGILTGWRTAIREGDLTAAELFAVEDNQAKAEALTNLLSKKAE